MTVSLFIKLKIIKASKRRETNVYAEKVRVIKNDQSQNIFIIHKSLAKNSYFFEFIRKEDFTMQSHLIAINAVISSIWNSLPVTNFEKSFGKMRKKQLLERLNSYQKRFSSTNHFDFDYENVLFGKTIFVFEIEDFVNLFAIETKKSNEIINFDVNDH